MFNQRKAQEGPARRWYVMPLSELCLLKLESQNQIDRMKEWSDLLTAIASLLWPILSFVSLMVFRPRISEFISRLKKGKLFGQEFELTETLSTLERRAVEGEAKVQALPQSMQQSLILEEDDITKQILHEASRSPKVGLLLLATELEKELRNTLRRLYPANNSSDKEPINFRRQMDELMTKQKDSLPAELAQSARLFTLVRNRIVHGLEASPDQTLSAIDSGLKILRSLKSLSPE